MLGAFPTAVLLVALIVLPAAAVSGPTKLLDPVAGPAAGTPTTTFSFAVTYRNREGSEPDHVQILVDGVAHVMATVDGADWKAGARFTWSSRLPVGTHEIEFRAMDRDRFTDSIAGGTVSVALPATPTPAPTPTPKPPPNPTPAPTPNPTPRPTPAATPDPTTAPTRHPIGTPAPTSPPPIPGSVGQPGPSGLPGDGDPGAPGGSFQPGSPGGPDGPSPSATPGSGGGAVVIPGDGGPGGPDGSTPDTTDPGGGTTGEPAVGHPGTRIGGPAIAEGWGDLTRTLESLGLDPVAPVFGVVPIMVTTSGAVAMTMAFLFFGKRRRDGAPAAPDEVLSAAAARGTGAAASGVLVGEAKIPLAPTDPDAAMPRWRRPSLLEARKADPLRNGVVHQALSFDHGLVGAVDGLERRAIRYHVVQLLDAPDELRGAEIGALLHGDEVQLMERSGTYWLVLCPDGRQGWIHRMTLGDVVGNEPAPTAEQTWSSVSAEPEDVDQDVLTAFMAARGRA